MLTPEAIEQLVKESTADIEDLAKKQIKEAVAYEIKSCTAKAIREAAGDYLKKHVVPAVQAMFVKEHSNIIKTALAVATAAGEALTEAMMQGFKDNMANNWKRKALLEKLFC